jgi:hypothetical protein
MSQLSPSEITKVRKAALQSVTLSSDMKATVVESRLKELMQDIKKILVKKDVVFEIVCLKTNA